MFAVQGPSHAEVDEELAAFEALFRDAVATVMRQVADELGRVTVAAAEPGEPAVSMDTLALIATLWIAQVQGTEEEEQSGTGILGAALKAVYRRAVNVIRRALLLGKKKPDIPQTPPVRQSPPTDVPSIPEHPGDETEEELDVIPDLPDDVAENYLSLARNRMVRFSDELWEVSREQLLEGFAEGESIEELRDRLMNVVGLTEKRATVVARTEIISASNAGSLAMVQYADFTGKKTWLATDDDRTRPTHHEAEGQTVALEEAFSVGGAPLQFPGDPSGPPEEIIQCRCALTYDLDDEPLTASADEFCRNPLHPGPCKGQKRGSKTSPSKDSSPKISSTPVKSDHRAPVVSNPKVINDVAEATAWGEKNFTPPIELSLEEYDALDSYINDVGYQGINGHLRGKEDDPDEIEAAERAIPEIDAVIRRNSVPEDVVVSRALGFEVFGGDPSGMVGSVVSDKGFLSTSLGDVPGETMGRTKPVHMTIKVPKGTPGYWLQGLSNFPAEKELLLGRDTRIGITSAAYDEGSKKWKVSAEVLA